MNGNKKKRVRVYRVVFIIYLALLTHFLFFSDIFGRTVIYEDYRYNLVPFKEIKRFWTSAFAQNYYLFIINIIGNVFLFVPFGFLFSVVIEDRHTRAGRRFIDTVLVGLVTCVLIETCQLLSKVGVFDVDDIILNLSGIVLGYLVYMCVRHHRIYRKKIPKKEDGT